MHRCQLSACVLVASEVGLALEHNRLLSPNLQMLSPCVDRAEHSCRELHKWGTAEPELLIFNANRCSQSHPAYILRNRFKSISFTFTIQNYPPKMKLYQQVAASAVICPPPWLFTPVPAVSTSVMTWIQRWFLNLWLHGLLSGYGNEARWILYLKAC